MAQQVNNPTINKDLRTILGSDEIRFSTTLSVRSHSDLQYTMGGGQIATHTGPPTVELTVELYLNQASNILDREFDFHKVEARLTTAVNVMDGRFMQRVIEPFRDDNPLKVLYVFRLKDVETSLYNLHQYALTQVDQEFTAALESKLLED